MDDKTGKIEIEGYKEVITILQDLCELEADKQELKEPWERIHRWGKYAKRLEEILEKL